MLNYDDSDFTKTRRTIMLLCMAIIIFQLEIISFNPQKWGILAANTFYLKIFVTIILSSLTMRYITQCSVVEAKELGTEPLERLIEQARKACSTIQVPLNLVEDLKIIQKNLAIFENKVGGKSYNMQEAEAIEENLNTALSDLTSNLQGYYGRINELVTISKERCDDSFTGEVKALEANIKGEFDKFNIKDVLDHDERQKPEGNIGIALKPIVKALREQANFIDRFGEADEAYTKASRKINKLEKAFENVEAYPKLLKRVLKEIKIANLSNKTLFYVFDVFIPVVVIVASLGFIWIK